MKFILLFSCLILIQLSAFADNNSHRYYFCELDVSNKLTGQYTNNLELMGQPYVSEYIYEFMAEEYRDRRAPFTKHYKGLVASGRLIGAGSKQSEHGKLSVSLLRLESINDQWKKEQLCSLNLVGVGSTTCETKKYLFKANCSYLSSERFELWFNQRNVRRKRSKRAVFLKKIVFNGINKKAQKRIVQNIPMALQKKKLHVTRNSKARVLEMKLIFKKLTLGCKVKAEVFYPAEVSSTRVLATKAISCKRAFKKLVKKLQ